MKIQVTAALAAAALAASTPARAADYHAEIIEWVFEPCMEVAAALDVDGMDQESRDLGIKREHIAELMLASRDSAIRDMTSNMNPGTAWEDRRATYPALLRMCIAQFTDK